MAPKELILTQESIQQRISELGTEITRDYAQGSLVMVGILNGAFIFMADLVRRIALPMEIDFVRVSSYGDKSYSSGTLTFTKDIELDIRDKDVLLVEDIVDSGRTIARLVDFFAARQPRSVKVCTLIDKPERREVEVAIDYRGFTIDHGFLVGYGLDYAEQHRHYAGVYHLILEEG